MVPPSAMATMCRAPHYSTLDTGTVASALAYPRPPHYSLRPGFAVAFTNALPRRLLHSQTRARRASRSAQKTYAPRRLLQQDEPRDLVPAVVAGCALALMAVYVYILSTPPLVPACAEAAPWQREITLADGTRLLVAAAMYYYVFTRRNTLSPLAQMVVLAVPLAYAWAVAALVAYAQHRLCRGGGGGGRGDSDAEDADGPGGGGVDVFDVPVLPWPVAVVFLLATAARVIGAALEEG